MKTQNNTLKDAFDEDVGKGDFVMYPSGYKFRYCLVKSVGPHNLQLIYVARMYWHGELRPTAKLASVNPRSRDVMKLSLEQVHRGAIAMDLDILREERNKLKL